jgi:hypothetical protein
MDKRDMFREIYKQRVLEAVLRGGTARRFHAYVDGGAVIHTRYGGEGVATSYASRTAAITAAKNSVDANIAWQSYLRRHDPPKAAEMAEKGHNRALENLSNVQRDMVGKTKIWVVPERLVDAEQRLADAVLRVERTRRDLELANKALAQMPRISE